MKQIKKRYKNLEEAYRELLEPLAAYASRRIYQKENKYDMVHDAFVKAQIYLNKHPGASISPFLLNREVTRACRRFNVTSVEIPNGSNGYHSLRDVKLISENYED